MTLAELFSSPIKANLDYLPQIQVSLRDYGLDEQEIKEVIGMMRGLINAIDGFKGVSDIDNETALTEPAVKLDFTTVEKANHFQACVTKYFSNEILAMIKTNRVRSAK